MRQFHAHMPQQRTWRITTTALTVAMAVALSGCATDRTTTGSVGSRGKPVEQMNGQELAASVESYRKLYERDSGNKTIAMAYASILRMNGFNDQGLAVMRKAAIQHPKDRNVLAAYGKALASAGEFTAALDAIQRAQDPTQPDWRLISAEGAIYDQTGRQPEARERYQRALQLRPNEPSVLSNMAMSHVLEGNLPDAETFLRTAVQQPGADSRVRQNLAMVVGLQGRFDEAMSIAQQELSPQQAKANVDYLQKMLAQQNAWSLIQQEDKSKAN